MSERSDRPQARLCPSRAKQAKRASRDDAGADFLFEKKEVGASDACSDVVEVRRIELLSENLSAKGTTSVVCGQHSLAEKSADKLFGSVAS